MKITLSISTCPNDTFMFDALIHKKIDTMGYEFDLSLKDIEQLNEQALLGDIDVTKVSYAAYPAIAENYQILHSGGAMGRGNGPLLVSRKKVYSDEIEDTSVGIPGKLTTANLLLSKFYPNIKEKREYLFSDIYSAVMDGEVDCGVLIHEERFNYKAKGLHLVSDLGQQWEEMTSLPVPLGAIVIKKSFSQDVKQDIEGLIKESVLFAKQHPSSSYRFVKNYARELDEDTIYKHIEMFVNRYSIEVTEEGKKAVYEMFKSGGYDNLTKIFI